MPRLSPMLSVFAMLILASCALTDSAPTHSGPVSHAAQGTETAHGSFTGASDHITTGTGSVFLTDAGWVVSLGSDFTFDGAPDPKVAFGNDGYDSNAILGKLESDTGAQTYVIPASLDVGDYNEIWIWCEQFDVPLGVAKLELN